MKALIVRNNMKQLVLYVSAVFVCIIDNRNRVCWYRGQNCSFETSVWLIFKACPLVHGSFTLSNKNPQITS